MSKRLSQRPRSSAFTLIELLVVMYIIAVLISSVAGCGPRSWAARRAVCEQPQANGSSVAQLPRRRRTCFRPASVTPSIRASSIPATRTTKVRTAWTWDQAGKGSLILPQMEQGTLFNAINFSLSVAYAANSTCSTTLLSVYLCPSDSNAPQVVPVLANPPDPAQRCVPRYDRRRHRRPRQLCRLLWSGRDLHPARVPTPT